MYRAWRYGSTILHLGKGWHERSASRLCHFTAGEGAPVPIAQEAARAQSRYGSCGIEKNLFPLPAIEPRSSRQSPVAVPTELSRTDVSSLLIEYL
jgi:hypothetical protein